MTFRTRHSFNVNTAMPGDVGKLIRVLEAWQPPAVFCMNSLNANDPFNVVVGLRNVMAQWGGKIIYRHYEDGEPELWTKYSADAYLNKLAAMNAPWAWFNVGNEPVTKDPDQMRRMSDFYAEIAVKAPGRGLRVILPGGFASGTYSRDELRAFKSMWQAMGAQRHLKADGWNVVMLGTHEYGHVDPRYHTDNDNIYDLMTPATARAHVFKTKADIFDGDPSDNWLILRTENILDIMAESCGVPRAQFTIDVAVTECVFERLPNVETQHRVLADALDAMQGEKTYGYPKSRRVLETLYGKPAAEVAADVFQWMESVYPDNYRVFCHFSWTMHNAHPHYWRDRYGMGEADDLHAAWTARIPKLGGSPVTTPAKVEPPADKGAPVRATLKEDYHVRSGPGVAFASLGLLRGGVQLTYYPATALPDIDTTKSPRQWVVVESGSVSGWMAWQEQFTPLVEFDEPTRQWPVPFQTQRATGLNNCGEAALTSLLNYWLEATKRPGQVMIEDIIASVNNAGSYATLTQLKTAAARQGLTLETRTGLDMAFLKAEIDAGRPFIALVERGNLPGTQSYYAFTGAHYVVVTGYGDGFVTLHDPLSLPSISVVAKNATTAGPGVHLKVSNAAFSEAWRKTTGNDAAYQALVAPAAEWMPITLPVPEEPPVVAHPISELERELITLAHEYADAMAAAREAFRLYDEARVVEIEKKEAFEALSDRIRALSMETLVLVERNAA